MKKTLQSNRLLLQPLRLNDAGFLLNLVNTPDWVRFIGDRNVKSEATALKYTQSILDNPDVIYWVVRLKDTKTPVGIISLVKRDYLNHPDLGFAFLPDHSGKGYAFEAATAVLTTLSLPGEHSVLLAVTIPQNTRSIALLERLRFSFLKEMEIAGENLRVYSISNEPKSLH
jgi:[ribosomal protein S5]-alanine N-acetyltransferase